MCVEQKMEATLNGTKLYRSWFLIKCVYEMCSVACYSNKLLSISTLTLWTSSFNVYFLCRHELDGLSGTSQPRLY